MTKLNWRDARKELPEERGDCVVITRHFQDNGTVITSTQNAKYFESIKKWSGIVNCHVVAWIYTSELLPMEGLMSLPNTQ